MGFMSMLIFKDSINKDTNFWHTDWWELHSKDVKNNLWCLKRTKPKATCFDMWQELKYIKDWNT